MNPTLELTLTRLVVLVVAVAVAANAVKHLMI